MTDQEEEDREFREHFSGFREGLKSFVVDLAERVSLRLERFRGRPDRGDPLWSDVSQGIFTQVANMFTGLFSQPDRADDVRSEKSPEGGSSTQESER